MYKTTVFGHKIAQDPWENRNKECGHYSCPSFINGRVFPSAVQGERTQTLQNLPVLRRQFGLWRYEVARICVQSIREEKATHKEFQQSVESFSWVFAVAAKSLQSCPTLCDPIDGSQPGSPVPGILQARTREWVAISFSNAWKWKVKVKLLSRVLTLSDPMDCSLPGSSIHGVFQARLPEWGAIAFSWVFNWVLIRV